MADEDVSVVDLVFDLFEGVDILAVGLSLHTGGICAFSSAVVDFVSGDTFRVQSSNPFGFGAPVFAGKSIAVTMRAWDCLGSYPLGGTELFDLLLRFPVQIGASRYVRHGLVDCRGDPECTRRFPAVWRSFN